MKPPLSDHVSSSTFKKVLAEGKVFLPSNISKELRRAGLGDILNHSQVSKQQALKIINHLQSKGVVSKSKPASMLFRHAAYEQREKNLAEEEVAKKHIRANISLDITEEEIELERGKSSRIISGKSIRDQIKTRTQSREEKIQKEKDKREKFVNPGGVRKDNPNLANMDKISDMDIG